MNWRQSVAEGESAISWSACFIGILMPTTPPGAHQQHLVSQMCAPLLSTLML